MEDQEEEQKATEHSPPATTSRQVLADILSQLKEIGNSLPPTAQASTNSILARLQHPDQDRARSVLLTLHFLFPHEFLPALDLLDRKLITRYVIGRSAVYYIQSASSVLDPVNKRQKRVFNATRTFYEVRIDSWNCSCAAFAQSSLRLLLGGDFVEEGERDDAWIGGMTAGPTPMCKHMLAAVLSEAAPDLFGGDVEVVIPSAAEAAAWAGGWGEL